MTPRPPSVAEAVPARAARQSSRRLLALAGLALFLLALTPRLIGLEQHLTPDDHSWLSRVGRFSQAVRAGHLRDTFQSSHPGVTVFWLACLGAGPRRLAALGARSENFGQLELDPDHLELLFDARRALALTSAGLTVVLACLTWRLFGLGPAALAGLLLAGEPFLVAHGRLLHADPLLAQLMAASVLGALIFFEGRGGWRYLVGSGLAAGLAVLTKAPAVFLFGFVPLLGFVWTWRRERLGPAGGARGLAALRPLMLQLALWGLAAGGIYVLLWPAMWVDPLGTLGRLVGAVRSQAESPRPFGNFFLGRATRGDVGPFFYPVATLLRLSPITLGGLLLAAWFALRRPCPARRAQAAALLAYVVLFTAMMTLSPKKIDRYLLPAYPVLVILAGLGLHAALRRRPRPGPRWAVGAALGLGQAALLAAVHPYPLSFYDPLLGGADLARRVVVVGWGEGTDQVAAFLDRQPNASGIVVASLYHYLIDSQSRATGVSMSRWERANHFVTYVNMEQRGLVPSPLRCLVRTPPLFSVHIGGIEYARVHRIPPELKANARPSGAPPVQEEVTCADGARQCAEMPGIGPERPIRRPQDGSKRRIPEGDQGPFVNDSAFSARGRGLSLSSC